MTLTPRLLVLGPLLAFAQAPAPSHDWPRFGFDAAGSNASPSSTGLTAANIATLRRQQVTIDGTVDASPIYLHGISVQGAAHDVFFVTTTYGKTIAIDAADGRILWEFTPPGYSGWAGSSRITTATPVADPDRAFVYAAAPDGRIRKLAVADGRSVWSASITELPDREKIASALNFDRGHVVAVTGGYIGDASPYQGHVAILEAATGKVLHVWNSLCSDRAGIIDPHSCHESGSAIWGRTGAVIDTASGDIFVATGNGRWDGRTNWGDATLELNADATRLVGNYTPTNTEALNESDADIGSTSPVLVGGMVVQGGKDGKLRLLDWPAMRAPAPHRGGETQDVQTPSGAALFTAPAVMHTGAATWLFAADGRAAAAWTLNAGRLRQVWKNENAGTSPVVAGGLLYLYDPGGGLRVYQPDTGRLLATIPCGGGHWNSPVIADGRIALPEGNANSHKTAGTLNIFRLP
jgi:outer membrane protein assembly factor BamB